MQRIWGSDTIDINGNPEEPILVRTKKEAKKEDVKDADAKKTE